MKNKNKIPPTKRDLFQKPADQYLDEQTKKLLEDRNPQLLETLFCEVNPYLARVCAASGIYEEHADDVIHATWERFFSNLDKFEGRSQIRTFICGILFNKIREYRRAQGRTLYEDDSEKVMNNSFTPEGWWKTTPHDPHKILDLGETAEFIKECLEGLSEQQKAAFLMREMEDEKSESICNILEINVSYLRVLLFRAKDKLRKCLEGKASVEHGINET